jgi:hypothetical protein
VAGIITISPGHDASYHWRQIGTAATPDQQGQFKITFRDLDHAR